MPFKEGRTSYQRIMIDQRRAKRRDWLILLMCLIVAICIGLSRRDNVEQPRAGAEPALVQSGPAVPSDRHEAPVPD